MVAMLQAITRLKAELRTNIEFALNMNKERVDQLSAETLNRSDGDTLPDLMTLLSPPWFLAMQAQADKLIILEDNIARNELS